MRKSVAERVADDEEESEINLTPMLDVVFIMLIFFIVTATFVKETGVDIARPDARTAEVPRRGSIFIAITAGNEIWIDRKRVEPNGVRLAVEKLSAENPEGTVVIQADGKARNELLIAVMDGAKEAGVTEITIATEDG